MLVRQRVTVGMVVAIVAAVTAFGVTGCGLEPAGFVALAGPDSNQSAVAASAAAGSQAASAVPTVKATFTVAIAAVASFGSPPAAYEMSVMSAIGTQQPIPGYSATMISDLEASGRAAIREYFGPPQEATERTALATAMALDSGSRVINLSSGVEKVSFGSVTVSGAVATVTARVTTWRRSVAREPLGASWRTQALVRVLEYTATLRHRMGGSWQVTLLSSVGVG
jgi:hypothetical protein